MTAFMAPRKVDTPFCCAAQLLYGRNNHTDGSEMHGRVAQEYI